MSTETPPSIYKLQRNLYDMRNERDRLKALNVALVAPLEAALAPFNEATRNPGGSPVGEPSWCSKARAAIAVAKEPGDG